VKSPKILFRPAEQIITCGESVQDFNEYQQEMYAELAPVGACEAALADQIVKYHWRLRRGVRVEADLLTRGGGEDK
jgi:hypothetical protein